MATNHLRSMPRGRGCYRYSQVRFDGEQGKIGFRSIHCGRCIPGGDTQPMVDCLWISTRDQRVKGRP
jgi:hypothetical protein